MTTLMRRRVRRPHDPEPFEVAASSSSTGAVDVLIDKIDAVVLLQRQYQANTGSLSGALIDRGASPVVSVSDRLSDLKSRTGLTWDQLARLFGVSKRAVLHWNSGESMSAGHEERLTHLLSRISDAPVSDPDAVRSWLMTLDSSGTAPYQRWVNEARRTDSQAAWIDRQPQDR